MIDIDKELEWVREDREDRHIGSISKHECVVDVDWVEELLSEVKRLRELLLPRIDEGYTTSYMDLRGIIEDVHWELTGDDHESNEERIKHALIALRDVIE